MPKRARYILTWLPANDRYDLCEQGSTIYSFRQREDAGWFTWLESHTSFSFQGKEGKVTFLKEPRVRGTMYWYAYRSRNRQTVKQYAGKTGDLTIARLEEVARSYTAPQSPHGVVPHQSNRSSNREEKPTDLRQRLHFKAASELYQVPLLEARFQAPLLPTPLIERQRLLEQLNALANHKLTLITAPAGSGKTTAISQWMESVRRREPAPSVAWLSCATSDNDPRSFWRYVITACQTFHAGPGHTSLAHLEASQPPLEMPALELILTWLLNDIVRLECSGFLILDNYHVITDPLVHETMAFFLDHLAPQLHVVILSRAEPPLALAGLRVRGDLCEIRTSDLRFSREEMGEILQKALPPSSLPFPSHVLNRLETRLEGWAAGLRLLTLSFHGSMQQQDIERLMTTFSGEQRVFQDYFVSEVLRTQSTYWQDFLLRTSFLSCLTGSLCDEVLGRQDSHRLLEDIERAGLFLASLDPSGQWYRYHPLFGEAMQAEARRRLGRNALSELSLQASCWYEQHGMLAEAVEAAFQAQDITRTEELLEGLLRKYNHAIPGPQVLEAIYSFYVVRDILEQLPEAVFPEHPILSLSYAASLLFCQARDQPPFSLALWTKIEALLQMAEEGFRLAGNMSGLGGALAFHSLIARGQGVFSTAITHAEEALSCLSEADQGWRNLSLNVMGISKIMDGHLDEAKKIFLDLCAFCEAFEQRAILRAHTVLLHTINYEQGNLRQSAAFFRQMHIEARNDDDYDDIAHASLFLAWLSYEWNDLEAAERQAQETLKLSQYLGNEEFQVQAALVLARIEHACEKTERAQQRCTTLLARIPATFPFRSHLRREIQMTQARFSLAPGDCSVVEQWRMNLLPDEELPLVQREREELLVAHWQLTQGHSTVALHTLLRLSDDARRMGRMRSALEIQAVLVLAWQACGDTLQVRQSLQTLLTYAQTEGYLRLFLDEGEDMITLLRITLLQFRERSLIAYVQMVLSAATSVDAKPTPAYMLLAEPLSSQEERILRLLLAGNANPDIAHNLVISVNTVKTHLKSIYRKLNVKNRQQACEAARHLEFH